MVGFNLSFKLNGWAQHNGWVQLLIEWRAEHNTAKLCSVGWFSSQMFLHGERTHEELCCCLQTVAPALLLVAKCFCFSVLFFIFYSKVGLNVLVQRANKFTPATRLLIQRFVPFPAVGKKERLFSIFKVLVVNLLVVKSHWDGHLTPAFLLYTITAMCTQQQVPESVQRNISAGKWCKVADSGSSGSFVKLHFPLSSSLKNGGHWLVLSHPN